MIGRKFSVIYGVVAASFVAIPIGGSRAVSSLANGISGNISAINESSDLYGDMDADMEIATSRRCFPSCWSARVSLRGDSSLQLETEAYLRNATSLHYQDDMI